jgi:SOS-response transcriptional repressor LexA
MTPMMRDALKFIASYTDAHNGVPPSFTEIAGALQIKSKSSVYRIICQLEERGLIRRLAKRPRAIEVVRTTVSSQMAIAGAAILRAFVKGDDNALAHIASDVYDAMDRIRRYV